MRIISFATKIVSRKAPQITGRHVKASHGAVYEKPGDGDLSRNAGGPAFVPAGNAPFAIPASWRWVRLGDVCSKIGAGSTPLGGRKVYVTKGVKFIREQKVHNDGIHYDGMAYIDEATNQHTIIP